MFRCSKCCKFFPGEPKKVWEEETHTYKFCGSCTNRINEDPFYQFTVTDWEHNPEDLHIIGGYKND